MLSAQSRAVLACGIGRVRALPARRVSWLWRARTSISGGLSAPQPPHIRPFALRAQIGGVPGSRTWQRPAALDWDAPSPACHHERPREHGSGPSQWFIDPIGHFSTSPPYHKIWWLRESSACPSSGKTPPELSHPTPEGKGGKHPGRPPGGRSTWCVLYIVSCKRFLSLSFALRPAKYELYTGRMYLSPFLPRASRKLVGRLLPVLPHSPRFAWVCQEFCIRSEGTIPPRAVLTGGRLLKHNPAKAKKVSYGMGGGVGGSALTSAVRRLSYGAVDRWLG